MLSHSETEKGDFIRTMHSKLESSSPVCIQIGLFTLVELDYVETETTSLRFPKNSGVGQTSIQASTLFANQDRNRK